MESVALPNRAPRLLLAGRDVSIMARLEGNKPNFGAILIGAVIFALVAGGLFFAFRSAPDDNAQNSVVGNAAVSTATNATSDVTLTDAPDAPGNALTTILTPIPTATPAPQITSTPLPTDNANAVAAPLPSSIAPAATPATANNLAQNSAAP